MLRYKCGLHISAHTWRGAHHRSTRCSTRCRSQLHRSRPTICTLPGFDCLPTQFSRRIWLADPAETGRRSLTIHISPSRLSGLWKMTKLLWLLRRRIVEDEHVWLF